MIHGKYMPGGPAICGAPGGKRLMVFMFGWARTLNPRIRCSACKEQVAAFATELVFTGQCPRCLHKAHDNVMIGSPMEGSCGWCECGHRSGCTCAGCTSDPSGTRP